MAARGKVLLNLGRKAIELLPTLSLVLAGIGVCMMAGLVVTEIVARSLFRFAVPFASEGVKYLIPYVALMGAAYTLRKEGHVRADIFLRRLPVGLMQWVVLLGYILGLGFLIILSRLTLAMAMLSLEKGYTSMSVVATPLGYPQLVMTIGLWLFALQLVVEIIRKARVLLPKS